MDYAERIAALNTAIAQSDPDDIERKSSALTTQLSRDAAYQQLEERRAEEKKRDAARYLGDAMKLAQRQKNFMRDFISKTPTSPYAVKFIPLVKQIDPLLATLELDRLQTLTANIDLTIREAGLRDAFSAFAELAPAAPAGSDSSPTVPLPKTEKNRFLVEGDLNDVVLLYNASPSAPHVARNLRGDVVFSDGRADVCTLGNNPDGFALTVESSLANVHPQTVTGLNQHCDPLRLASYDIIATQRGAFLRLDAADALSLLKSIETGEFRKLTLVTAAELKEAEEAERRKIEEIASDVANGSASGYGLILLTSGSPNICMVASKKTDGHSHLLLAAADKLSFVMHTAPTITSSNAESAFAEVQKGQCNAVYAAAADLKNLTGGHCHVAGGLSFRDIGPNHQ